MTAIEWSKLIIESVNWCADHPSERELIISEALIEAEIVMKKLADCGSPGAIQWLEKYSNKNETKKT